MTNSPALWRRYQEEAAALFKAMGFTANVEETLVGARAQHEVDVVVRLVISGVAMLWIVECKHWKSAVRKEQVMTLASITQDVGADRAFLLSESGFQSGALTAVRNTNVTLTSLAELTEVAKNDIATLLLRRLLVETVQLRGRLYRHLFDERGQSLNIIAADLDEVTTLLGACLDMVLAINRAMAGDFPVSLSGLLGDDGSDEMADPTALTTHLRVEVKAIEVRAEDLERKASQNRQELLRRADELVGEVRNLVDLSGTIFTAETEAVRDAARQRCLIAMRAIGDLADGLRNLFRGCLSAKLKTLMRTLIDGLYVALTKPQVRDEEWDKIRAQTLGAAETFRSALTQERVASYP